MIDFTNKAITTKSDLESEQLLKKAVAQGFGLPKGEKALITNRFFRFIGSPYKQILIPATISHAEFDQAISYTDLFGDPEVELRKIVDSATRWCRAYGYNHLSISGNVDMDVFYTDYRTEQKGEVTVTKTKLQKFTDLGDYYANNGGNKPYLEKRTNAYLDDFQKNAGYNNYTKFARDVDNWGQPGCQGQPWCAEYQFWKLVKILGITKALQIMGGGFYNCQSITQWAKKNGTWHSTPKDGSLVIFRDGSHIGSVRSYSNTYIYTNEGNTSSAAGVIANGGSCRNKRYLRSDPAIDGYVWIDWGEEKTVAETWKATGTATSTVDDLYVREAPNGYVLGQINKGNRVEINGEKSGMWTKVKVAGIGIGWAATKYLQVDGAENKPTTITNKQNKTQRLFVGKVSAASTVVRTWAGGNYPSIKKWPKLVRGNLVDVMNFTQKATNGASWHYVRIEGKYYGFVAAKDICKV